MDSDRLTEFDYSDERPATGGKLSEVLLGKCQRVLLCFQFDFAGAPAQEARVFPISPVDSFFTLAGGAFYDFDIWYKFHNHLLRTLSRCVLVFSTTMHIGKSTRFDKLNLKNRSLV